MSRLKEFQLRMLLDETLEKYEAFKAQVEAMGNPQLIRSLRPPEPFHLETQYTTEDGE